MQPGGGGEEGGVRDWVGSSPKGRLRAAHFSAVIVTAKFGEVPVAPEAGAIRARRV